MVFGGSTAWHLFRHLSIFWKEVVFGFFRRTYPAISFLLNQWEAECYSSCFGVKLKTYHLCCFKRALFSRAL